MEPIVDNILNWISQNPHWAVLVVFAIAFLESLAVVGLLVPGWLLLAGVGSLIGAGHLNFWWISLGSFVGASLGQIISFSVGRYFQEKVHQWPWVQRHQKLMDKSESFFKRHGFAGILIGQFIGPIRAVISLTAGISNMPRKRFILAVLLATLVWAPFYMLPGVVVGAALSFEPNQIWILLACLLAIAVCSWLLIHFAWDYFSQKKNRTTTITAKRMGFNLLAFIILSATLGFLMLSSYGSLMLELIRRIWQLIGHAK